jgi:hypothetical protein
MSFNELKVAKAEPDVTGNIELTLDDLNDVGDVLYGQSMVYDASTSQWVGASLSFDDVTDLALFGQGESDDYANSGFSLSAGQVWGFYDSSPVNYIESSVTFNKVSGTHWLESISLLKGTYHIFAQTHLELSASGYLEVALFEGSTQASKSAVVGTSLSSTDSSPATIDCILTVDTFTTVTFNVVDVLNASASQGNTPAERGVILIRRAL